MVKKTKETETAEEQLIQDLKYSNSAILYLLTEQQALLGKLLEELVRVGALNNDALVRVTGSEGEEATRTAIYMQLYKKFAGYLVICQEIIDNLNKGKGKE